MARWRILLLILILAAIGVPAAHAKWFKEKEQDVSSRHRQHPRWSKQNPMIVDPNSTRKYIVVDADGNGDFLTLQGAIDSVPDNNTQPVNIFIGPGEYREKVIIPEDKPFITLDGSGADMTIINWDDYAARIGTDGLQLGTFHTATVHVRAPYFSARGITFKNSAPSLSAINGPQAVALQVTGDMAAFYDCKFIGIQDTLYDHSGRHYFKNCVIQGAVDFIFGNGQSIYRDCEIVAIGYGSVTAQKRQSLSENTGFAFVNCKVVGNNSGVYLGRAWGVYSRVLFLYSYMDAVVTPGGWDDWGEPSRHSTVYYAEFNCTGPGATTQRVPWMVTLSEPQARFYIGLNFIDGETWLPFL